MQISAVKITKANAEVAAGHLLKAKTCSPRVPMNGIKTSSAGHLLWPIRCNIRASGRAIAKMHRIE